MGGRLTVVGTGIMFPSQMTFESADAIRDADEVFFNVGAHPLAVKWLKEKAKKSVDLYDMYADGKDRSKSYAEMVEAIVSSVKKGNTVAAAFYGHPGVFVGPSFDAINECRVLGYPAVMLPGVCAVDCMFADLEFDPASFGCTMLEATDYLFHKRTLDPNIPLVIWQAGVVADLTFNLSGKTRNLDILKQRLGEDYPKDHAIIAYHAPTLPGMKPIVEVGTIGKIEAMNINASTTCLVRPRQVPSPDETYFDVMRERMTKAQERMKEAAG